MPPNAGEGSRNRGGGTDAFGPPIVALPRMPVLPRRTMFFDPGAGATDPVDGRPTEMRPFVVPLAAVRRGLCFSGDIPAVLLPPALTTTGGDVGG